MRTLIIALLTVGLAGMAAAANVDAGSYEVRTSGNIEFQSSAGTRIDLEFGIGHFLVDLLEAGAIGGIFDDDDASRWKLGGFVEYNFVTETPFFPYVGGVLSLSGADLKIGNDSENNTAIELDTRAGVKYFLTEDLALDALLSLQMATDDLYLDDRDAQKHNWRILFGLRYFFDM
jgi:hypothetical protein